MPCFPAIRKTGWRPTSITRRPPRHSTGSPWRCRSRGGVAAALLAQVRDAAADLERSEQLAREDIRLAAQAQSEINDGAAGHPPGSRLWRHGHQHRHVLRRNLSSCRQSSFCDRRTTSKSIQYAGAATQLARQVYYAAMQQAMMQQDGGRWPNNGAGLPGWLRRAGDGISFGAAAATAAAADDPRKRRRPPPRRRQAGPSPSRQQPAARGAAKRPQGSW